MKDFRPRASMIVAVVALIAAGTGTAVAGPSFAKIKPNSIGSKQIKDDAITGSRRQGRLAHPSRLQRLRSGPGRTARPAGAPGSEG